MMKQHVEGELLLYLVEGARRLFCVRVQLFDKLEGKQPYVTSATHFALVLAKTWMLPPVLKHAADKINLAESNVLKRHTMKPDPPPFAQGTPKRQSSTASLQPTKKQKRATPLDSTEAAEPDERQKVAGFSSLKLEPQD